MSVSSDPRSTIELTVLLIPPSDKQLKKSIKRIEKELQALGLNAEILRELLSGSPLEGEDGNDDHHSDPSRSQNGQRMNGESHPPTLKKSGSGRSLGKSTAALSSPQKAKRKTRRQARARAEYELAGKPSRKSASLKLSSQC